MSHKLTNQRSFWRIFNWTLFKKHMQVNRRKKAVFKKHVIIVWTGKEESYFNVFYFCIFLCFRCLCTLHISLNLNVEYYYVLSKNTSLELIFECKGLKEEYGVYHNLYQIFRSSHLCSAIFTVLAGNSNSHRKYFSGQEFLKF
jgi:hypothetical protein